MDTVFIMKQVCQRSLNVDNTETPEECYDKIIMDYPNTEAARLVKEILRSESEREKFSTIAVSIPEKIAVYPVYPNPFNAQTVIRFELPATAETIIRIHDITGKEVWSNRGNTHYSAGSHTVIWNGTGFKGNLLPTGIYIATTKIDNYLNTQKMILLK